MRCLLSETRYRPQQHRTTLVSPDAKYLNQSKNEQTKRKMHKLPCSSHCPPHDKRPMNCFFLCVLCFLSVAPKARFLFPFLPSSFFNLLHGIIGNLLLVLLVVIFMMFSAMLKPISQFLNFKKVKWYL